MVLIGAAAGYAFAWMDFPGRDWVFIGIVALLVIPIQIALIPTVKLYSDLHISGSILSVVIFHVAFGLPFAIFLLRNYFAGIPRDLMEAARMDGASEGRIFFRIILPLGARPSPPSGSSSSSGCGTTCWSPWCSATPRPSR